MEVCVCGGGGGGEDVMSAKKSLVNFGAFSLYPDYKCWNINESSQNYYLKHNLLAIIHEIIKN